MELIWKALKTTGEVLRYMWEDMHWQGQGQGQGQVCNYEEFQGYAWPAAREEAGSGMPVHVLPPAEHNGWGSVADYTFGSPD